ncbi:MAG: hypothetical protein U0795_27145 [Pirellulales bacterium]
MRYINSSHLSRLADLTPIDALNNGIADASVTDKGKYLDDHDGEWSYLKGSLWTLGAAKCWFSEDIIQRDGGHVEHFRPKKRLSGASHPGYWWRAFDWTNFRFAHPTVNLRITDYLTGKKAGKGGYFPLRDESLRASSKADEGREEPVLLDPTSAEDCRLLCFELSSGKPIPRYKRDQNEWLHRRAKESIDYFHLDEATWNKRRKDLIDEFNQVCDELENALTAPAVDQAKYDKVLGEIMEYLDPFAEFTAAILAVLRERGLLEHLGPATPA